MSSPNPRVRLVPLGMLACASLVASHPAATAAPRGATVVASSTFDADAEGWTILGEAQGPNFQATGGRPGGYVAATDPPSTTGTSYWQAPGKFLGDRSSSYGQKLTFDLRDDGPGSAFRDPDVVVGNGALVLEYRQSRRPSAKRWSRFAVKLDGRKGWTDASTGRRALTSQMRDVLASLDLLLIRGEFRNGPETFDLDNVVLRGKAR